jgi:transcriptional regulator with XRE-family HTH domain
MSQEQLAERADTHWTYVSGIERGRHNPGLNMIGRLAKALHVSPSELLSGLAHVSQPRPKRDRRD